MTPSVSIIIPIYNTAQYLEACLSSVISQTHKDIEIILVDDGSTDGSQDIIHSFAAKDDRIVVLSQPNQGVSVARNTGIKAARGEYIFFVDSDDVVKGDDAVEKLYQQAKLADVDILLGNFVTLYPNGLEKNSWHRLPQSGRDVQQGDHCFAGLIERNSFIPLVYVFFIKRTFLLDKQLFFEKGIAQQDELWGIQTLIQAKRVAFSDFIHYYYRIREGSTTHSKDKIQFRIQSYRRVVTVLQEFIAGLKERNEFVDSIGYIYIRVFYVYRFICRLLCMMDEKENEHRAFFEQLLDEITPALTPFQQQACINYFSEGNHIHSLYTGEQSMTILFSAHIQQQDDFSFCEKVLHLLEAGGHQVKIVGAPEMLLKQYPNIDVFDPNDTQLIDIVMTYTQKGLNQIKGLTQQANAPIIHLVNTENLEEEYPDNITPINKIILAGSTNIEVLQSEIATPIFLPPVAPKIKCTDTEETENKKQRILVDIKTTRTNGYSLLYRLAPLFNTMINSEITVLVDKKPLLPLFNKNVSLILRKEADVEKLLSESDLIIGSGDSIYKGIALEKPCIVVGEQGYGGIVTPQNFDLQHKANFQGRIGGYLNEFVPEDLLADDIERIEKVAKEEVLKNASELKELLGKEFEAVKKQWNICFSTAIHQYRQQKNNLLHTKLKLSDTFILIGFSEEKFVLTCQTTRKVHSDFGKAEADIINAFRGGCVVQDALKNCGYTDDAEMFLEFINMLLDEKILVIDG